MTTPRIKKCLRKYISGEKDFTKKLMSTSTIWEQHLKTYSKFLFNKDFRIAGMKQICMSHTCVRIRGKGQTFLQYIFFKGKDQLESNCIHSVCKGTKYASQTSSLCQLLMDPKALVTCGAISS